VLLHLCSPFDFFMAWTGTSLYNSSGHFTGLQTCRRYWCCVCMALLDGKRSGLLCPSLQSWKKQAEDLILQHDTVCHHITLYHHVQKIHLIFLLHEICVLLERDKKFLSIVIFNSAQYYFYQIESITVNIVRVF
jgi:hypothetical protein